MPLYICLLILSFTLLPLVAYSIFGHPHNALAPDQSLSTSKPQTWIDNLSNIKIEFTSLKDIDKPTQLKFDASHFSKMEQN